MSIWHEDSGTSYLQEAFSIQLGSLTTATERSSPNESEEQADQRDTSQKRTRRAAFWKVIFRGALLGALISGIGLSIVITMYIKNLMSNTTQMTTSTTTSVTSVTSTTSTTSETTTTTALYWISGPILNLDPADLTANGWSQCYNSTYSVGLTSSLVTAILAECNGTQLLLACKPTTATNYTLAAMGNRSDVLYNCGSTSTCAYVANGVGWYFSDNYSWGFINGGDSLSRSSCDTASTDPNYRLCWHTIGVGGYRCGANTALNSATNWERSIWQAN